MDKGMKISDFADGKQVKGVFAVQRFSQAKKNDGNPFWSLLLSDSTGSIDAKIWTPKDCGLSVPPSEGAVLSVLEATVTTYRNALQLTVRKAHLLTESNEVDASWFCRTGPHAPAELWEELSTLRERRLTYRPWVDFLAAVFADKALSDAFCRAPGAVEVHHAYVGGLLEHTLGVCKLVLQFCDLYPDLDRELLFVGAFLHDIGKIVEYDCGTTISVTDEGRLLGHIGAGLCILEPFFKQSSLSDGLIMHLKHLILSHHGELAFGSPVLPQTQEAIALHFADNFDAKMAICKKALLAKKAPQHWTDPIFSLDKRRLVQLEKTPAGLATPEKTMAAHVSSPTMRNVKSPEQKPVVPESTERTPAGLPTQEKTIAAQVSSPTIRNVKPPEPKNDFSEPEYTDDDFRFGSDSSTFSLNDAWEMASQVLDPTFRSSEPTEQKPDFSEPEYTDDDIRCESESCTFSLHNEWTVGDPPSEMLLVPESEQFVTPDRKKTAGEGKTTTFTAEKEFVQSGERDVPPPGPGGEESKKKSSVKKSQSGKKKKDDSEEGEEKKRTRGKKKSNAEDVGEQPNIKEKSSLQQGSLLTLR